VTDKPGADHDYTLYINEKGDAANTGTWIQTGLTTNGASPLPITAVGNELDSTSGTIMHGGWDEGYNSTSLPNGFALGRMVRV